jgi:hypothetical protein
MFHGYISEKSEQGKVARIIATFIQSFNEKT